MREQLVEWFAGDDYDWSWLDHDVIDDYDQVADDYEFHDASAFAALLMAVGDAYSDGDHLHVDGNGNATLEWTAHAAVTPPEQTEAVAEWLTLTSGYLPDWLTVVIRPTIREAAELRLNGLDISDPSAHARGVIATVDFSEAAIEIEMGRITAHWSRLQN